MQAKLCGSCTVSSRTAGMRDRAPGARVVLTARSAAAVSRARRRWHWTRSVLARAVADAIRRARTISADDPARLACIRAEAVALTRSTAAGDAVVPARVVAVAGHVAAVSVRVAQHRAVDAGVGTGAEDDALRRRVAIDAHLAGVIADRAVDVAFHLRWAHDSTRVARRDRADVPGTDAVRRFARTTRIVGIDRRVDRAVAQRAVSDRGILPPSVAVRYLVRRAKTARCEHDSRPYECASHSPIIPRPRRPALRYATQQFVPTDLIS